MATRSLGLEQSVKPKQGEQLESAARFIIAHVDLSGHMSASPSYKGYVMHWLRDSAFTTTALLEAGEFLTRKNPELSARCIETAQRINSFNIGALTNHIGNIREGIERALEYGDFNELKYHVPAKVGKDGRIFRGWNGKELIDDKKNMGLVQNDSVPLVLLALEKEHDTVGLDQRKVRFLQDHMKTLVEYMAKYYKIECCNAWEENCDKGHAYDVGAIYAGLEAAKRLSAALSLDCTPKMIDDIADRHWPGGPAAFLRDFFVKDGILYGMREKGSDKHNPMVNLGVDTQLIFAFNMFGVTDKILGDGVVARTMREIERTLFKCDDGCSPHILGWRYLGDEYFTGGRWLVGGAQRANYYMSLEQPNLDIGRVYSEYFKQFGGSYPEQILEHRASNHDRPEEFLRNNGYQTIQDLIWSYAEVLRFEVRFQRLLDRKRGQLRQEHKIF